MNAVEETEMKVLYGDTKKELMEMFYVDEGKEIFKVSHLKHLTNCR